MSRGTVISLCDRTGNMVRPWLAAGYRAVTIDLQPATPESGRLHIVANVSAMRGLSVPDAVAVFAFPPCTNLAVSGARWFQSKGLAGLVEGLEIVDACRNICEGLGVPWMLENPVSVISSYWRKWDHVFHPCDYTGFELTDNYTKKTCLWTGNGFVMPAPTRAPALGAPDDRVHKAPPSDGRGDFRSVTPMGFARAVFNANAPHLALASAVRLNRAGSA